jgi:hypothetical protein
LLEPLLWVGYAAEAEFAFGAQPFAGFTNVRECVVQCCAVSSSVKLVYRSLAEGARRAQAQQLQQLVKFQNVLRGSWHGLRISLFL